MDENPTLFEISNIESFVLVNSTEAIFIRYLIIYSRGERLKALVNSLLKFLVLVKQTSAK